MLSARCQAVAKRTLSSLRLPLQAHWACCTFTAVAQEGNRHSLNAEIEVTR